MLDDTKILYSTNTYLSYLIAKMYFAQKFFVWCSPIFDPRSVGTCHPYAQIPPSSSPLYIYSDLRRAISGNDTHCSKIEQNRTGLTTAANIYLGKKQISVAEYNIILSIIEKAPISDFRPLVYLIPLSDNIRGRLEEVPVDERANPSGVEYRLQDLSIDEFDAIEFGDIR